MRKPLIYCIAVTTLLTIGCSSSEDRRDQEPSFMDKFSIVHEPEVQQGNIINQEMVNKLRPGMDKGQIRFIMGTPLLVVIFGLVRLAVRRKVMADRETVARSE